MHLLHMQVGHVTQHGAEYRARKAWVQISAVLCAAVPWKKIQDAEEKLLSKIHLK